MRNRILGRWINGFTAAIMAAGCMLALAVLPMSGLSSVASAAGGDIRVVSSNREVRFPQDVLFSLQAEGDANIVEVRLYYRTPSSGGWAYAYPEVEPSRQVSTSYSLALRGMSYLPPGTEVEYYYSIRDSQGNVLNTDPTSFTYVDGRFQWRSEQAGPLTLYWHNRDPQQVRRIARQVEISVKEVARILSVELDTPLRGVIYNSQREARDAFPYQSDTTTEGSIFRGYAFPDRNVFVGVGLDPGLIVHETAHLLMSAATDSPLARVPAWVNEGFASYVEPGAQRRGALLGADQRLMPLSHMAGLPGRPAEIRYFYRKSESVVGYLLEEHGDGRFRAFLARLNEAHTPDVALRETYSFGIEELDNRWAESMRGAPAAGGGRGSVDFAYFDTILIATVVLLAFAAVVMGLAAKRFAGQGPDAEERLTQAEWDDRP